MGAVGFFFKLAMKIRVGITTSDLLILYCSGIKLELVTGHVIQLIKKLKYHHHQQDSFKTII